MLRKEKDVTETKRRVTENGKTQKFVSNQWFLWRFIELWKRLWWESVKGEHKRMEGKGYGKCCYQKRLTSKKKGHEWLINKILK